MTSARDHWNPGLDNDDLRLEDVYCTMPGDAASTVPWYVRLLENPQSPVALPGNIGLFGHDCIHILLGRGLLAQDKAFVMGFTMGAAKASHWAQAIYRFAALRLYRAPYRFGPVDAAVFDLALDIGRHQRYPLNRLSFTNLVSQRLGALRAQLGISSDVLRAAYAVERGLWPDTIASARLPALVQRARAAARMWPRR
jgi:hypothetical protein